MNEDEDCEDEIGCPFCKSTDGCSHLVASFDHENASVAGGLFFDRESEITDMVRAGFCDLFAARGEQADWHGQDAFDELWADFMSRRDDPDEEPLDPGLVAHLLDELLRDTDAICVGEDAVVAFFDRNPGNMYGRVLTEIGKAFASARGSE
jgi:hypothetical protein